MTPAISSLRRHWNQSARFPPFFFQKVQISRPLPADLFRRRKYFRIRPLRPPHTCDGPRSF